MVFMPFLVAFLSFFEHHILEISKEGAAVRGTRSRFRVMLYRNNRFTRMPEAFYCLVIQIDMGGMDTLRQNMKSVVL